MKQVTVEFHACGHKNVLSTHKTTFEVTKETELTKNGNCIIAVSSTMGAIDLPDEFKKAAQKENSKIMITIEADNQKETTTAKGSPRLQLTHPTDLVVRKSKFVCNRTLAIEADKASIDFSKKLVEKLQDPNQKVKVTLTVENH
ncbi:MAG: DUF371 domain-containing protein [archaeon]|nr:DUF371 domain-containing protein [Candidatus Bathyarchaeum sp.]